jgi:2,3-bisphosphoglycerate-dependent phosphoglycerate mutase
MTKKLILLRHGESEWNALNLFTGWVDVRLSEKGIGEAKRGGQLLKERGLLPDIVHTSLLRRAIHTSQLALDEADRHWIPVIRTWRLAQYGEEQFQLWRRSFDVPPPPIDDNDKYSQFGDARYADLGSNLPKTECLKDVVNRMVPYLDGELAADLNAGKTVLVTAHGNSIRAMVKHIDCISDTDIAGVNIPTGIPLLYEFDDNFEPIKKGGEYLDPEAAKSAIEAVANQGKK